MKDIRVLRDNARSKIEALNMAVMTEDKAQIASAEEAANLAVTTVNEAIIENDFESFKSSKVPVDALIRQCFHTLDRMKKSKVKGTQRAIYAYEVGGNKVEISLSDAADSNVITGDYAPHLEKLYGRFAGRTEVGITKGSVSHLDKKTGNRKPNPFSKTTLIEILQDVFNLLYPALENERFSPLKSEGKDIEFMKATAAKFTKGVAGSLSPAAVKVREQGLIRAAHTRLTNGVYTMESMK